MSKPDSQLTTLAFYLPQFHAIPENDAWWGPGFTEWTHLHHARPMARGHAIRRPIAPLGEYSLDDPGTLEAQWELAARHGIDGFAVWHYWFGDGRRLLQKPMDMVLKHRLRFKYCLAWANHSWYDKVHGRLLCQQRYPGPSDYERFFRETAAHFESDNYIRIAGRPVFILFDPHAIPDLERFLATWRTLVQRLGMPDMYFVADRLWEQEQVTLLLDKYSNSFGLLTRRNKLVVNYVKEWLKRHCRVNPGIMWFDFRKLLESIVPHGAQEKFAPTVITGWDTTPRHGTHGTVFEHLDAAAFRAQLVRAQRHFSKFPQAHHLLLLKSWNEWAEGNIMEPDSLYGDQFLQTFREFRRSIAG